MIWKLLINPQTWEAILFTFGRMLLGLFVSLVIALLIAWLMSKHRLLKSFFYPILVFFRSVPVVSTVLLAMIWFISPMIPYIVAFVTMFPILCQNFYQGLCQWDSKLERYIHQYPIQKHLRLAYISWPLMQPHFKSGLLTAAGFGWRAVIMGEVLAQLPLGMGGGMRQAQIFERTEELIFWTLLAIGLSFIFDMILKMALRIRIPLKWETGKDRTFELAPISEPVVADSIVMRYDTKRVIDRFHLQIAPGELFSLEGPSGCGKSTIIHLFARIQAPTSGSIDYPKALRISTLFQDDIVIDHLTVAQNIALPLMVYYQGKPLKRLVDRVLRIVELDLQADSYPSQLSGGELSRVMLARAIAFPAHLLLLDEPFSSLDMELKQRIIAKLTELWSSHNTSVLLVSHDSYEPIILHATRIRL